MILFIDDERRVMDSYRDYLALKLTPQGYEVLFLSDIDKALDFLENRPDEIDLIILDVMMPTGKKLNGKHTVLPAEDVQARAHGICGPASA